MRTLMVVFVVGSLVFNAERLLGATFDVTDAAGFQTALTTAQSNGENDTVNVAAGTYSISSTLSYSSTENYSLTIIGAGATTTILDGGDSTQIMRISNEADGDVAISGLTLRNGRMDDITSFGGALLVVNGPNGSITIDSCVATSSTAIRNTGGAWLGAAHGDITVTNSSFTENTCDDGTSDDGCGLYLYFDGDDATGNAIVRGNVVSDNTLNTNPSPVGNCDGAGMMIYHLGTSGTAPTITIENNTFDNNLSYEGVGGVSLHILHTHTQLTVRGNTFSNNVSGPVPPGVPIGIYGGGIHTYVDGGDMIIENNLFLNNKNNDPYGLGAGLCLDNLPSGTVRVCGNVFAGNQCAGIGGGAVVNPGSGVTSAVIAGNLFVENQAGLSEGSGGGVSISADANVSLVNNTFYKNIASDGGGMTFYTESSHVATLVNNIYRGDTPNAVAVFGGSVQATYSNIQGASEESWFGTGCIDADPLFSDAANPKGADGVYATEDDGLHLTSGSPSANTGNTSAVPSTLTTDVAGGERIQGGTVDMGAYEGTAGGGNTLSVSLSPSTIQENGGTSTGTVTRPGETTAALEVALTSSDATVATVPASVTIEAGSSTATFTATAVDNPAVTGDRTSVITASATDMENGAATLTVTDDDSLSLTVSPGSISENGGTATGTVSTASARETDLTVSLASSNTAAATVPTQVTISTGSTQATFTVTGVDDGTAAGDRTVTITASATGFGDGTASVTVVDDDTTSVTVTLGSIYTVAVDDLGDDVSGNPFSGDAFNRKPKIYGAYYDPVKDPSESRLRNASAKVTYDASSPTSVDCEWKKKICLYDKKAIDRSQTAEEYIPEAQTAALTMAQWVSATDDDGNSGPFSCGDLVLTVPLITAVYDSTGETEITSAVAGTTIVVEGTYFGVKAPKAWLEVAVEKSSGTQIKAAKCKILKPLPFRDAKGGSGKSCMDLTSSTGLSRFRCQLPSKIDAGEHNIVIDNTIGRATVGFTIE